MKIYLIAGEPSGDLLGSRLMRAMYKKTDNQVLFRGIGGDTMEAEGLKSLFDISDLAIMGLAEIIPSIPKVLKRIKQTVNDIIEFQPDVIITIDSWSFSSRVHKALRKKKLNIPQMHYVAPQVWAWKKKRAKTMYKYIDCLMTLLPYESKYFTPYGLETHFVGHPVIESEAVHGSKETFLKNFNVDEGRTIVSILPGSRRTEVSKLLPVFLETAEKMYAENPNLQFVIPTVKNVAESVKLEVKKHNLPIIITETQKDRYDAFKASSLAMAASGTVALELAILDVPHIIAYKVTPMTAYLVRKFIQIQFVNLSNILLGREIIPELLQERCISGNVKSYMDKLLKHEEIYETQIEGFKKVREALGFGEQSPSEKACDIILNFITDCDK